MEYQSEKEYLDALYDAHLDGLCQEFLKQSTYCTYCQLELDRIHYEEKKSRGEK